MRQQQNPNSEINPYTVDGFSKIDLNQNLNTG
jgi:hypothetical protein